MSRFIRRDSFRCNLNFLFSFKRIVKSSILASWPFSKMWLNIAHFLGFFTRFPVKDVISGCSEALTKKCLSDSPWEVALQQLHVNLYTRCELISLGMISLKRNRLESLVLDWKAILKEQYGKWFLIQLCSRFQTKKDWAPRNGKTMSSCFLLTVSWIALVTWSFWRKCFMHLSINWFILLWNFS